MVNKVQWAPERNLKFLAGTYTVKKNFLIFPSPAGMSLTKLSLGGNTDVIYILFPPQKSPYHTHHINIAVPWLICHFSGRSDVKNPKHFSAGVS
jgi:hypothetical protein